MEFSCNEEEVGGTVDVVPIERWAVGGSVGSRERRWLPGDDAAGLANTYYR